MMFNTRTVTQLMTPEEFAEREKLVGEIKGLGSELSGHLSYHGAWRKKPSVTVLTPTRVERRSWYGRLTYATEDKPEVCKATILHPQCKLLVIEGGMFVESVESRRKHPKPLTPGHTYHLVSPDDLTLPVLKELREFILAELEPFRNFTSS